MHAIGIELANQPARDDLALVLVAVVTGGHQRGGSLAVADARDRNGDDPVGVAVVGVPDLEPAHPAPGGVEVDAAVDAGLLRAHAFTPPSSPAGRPVTQSRGIACQSSKDMARPGKAGLAKGQVSAIHARTVR